MPDSDEEARWKARYQAAQDAYQICHSKIARLEARLDAVEKTLAAKTDEVARVERAAAKADREATRKRRFQERVAASIAARQLRDKP